MKDAVMKSGARPETGGTLFSCHAPAAGAVSVAGTFNDWSPTATPLTRQSDGT